MFYWNARRGPMWSEFGRLQRNLDDLVRQMNLSSRPSLEPWLTTAYIFPAINVVKESNSYVATAEIPGINSEDLEIKVEGDTLSIKGERKIHQSVIKVICSSRVKLV